MTDAEYLTWLQDARRNKHRVLLIIAEHSAGTVYFASQAYRSSALSADFNDFLMNTPVLDQTLSGTAGVGDFTVHTGNLTGIDTNQWRGHDVLLMYGDISWPVTDFRTLAKPLIDSVDYESGTLYTFRLIDRGYLYESKVTTTESKTDTVNNLITWVKTTGGFSSLAPVNLTGTQLAAELSVNVEADRTKWKDVLELIADSVGGYFRVNANGGGEVIVQSGTSTVSLTDEDIIKDSIRQFDSEPAMESVDVLYNWTGGYDVTSNDPDKVHSTITETTTADTGLLSESETITTALTTLSDAQDLADHHKLKRSTVQKTYELEVVNKAAMLAIRDTITINSGVLSGDFLVTRIKLSPTDQSSLIEVRQ